MIIIFNYLSTLPKYIIFLNRIQLLILFIILYLHQEWGRTLLFNFTKLWSCRCSYTAVKLDRLRHACANDVKRHRLVFLRRMSLGLSLECTCKKYCYTAKWRSTEYPYGDKNIQERMIKCIDIYRTNRSKISLIVWEFKVAVRRRLGRPTFVRV